MGEGSSFMVEKKYSTSCGIIHYWITEKIDERRETLVFLPGLTADHRLFDRQTGQRAKAGHRADERTQKA